jgi:hypothetical protein
MSEHIALKGYIDRQFAAQLAAPAQLLQDALLLHFSNGLRMELRLAGADEYALSWQWGDARLRIDTAPLHPELSTFPQHLHDMRGVVHADPITQPGRAPQDNAGALIDALLRDPLLGTE